MKKKTILIAIVSIFIIGILFSQISSLNNLSKIKGNFEKVAFVRNENNLEAILKIYAVSVGDIENANYKAYVKAMPRNAKSGEMIFYFFDKNKAFPQILNLQYPHFDTMTYKAIHQISLK